MQTTTETNLPNIILPLRDVITACPEDLQDPIFKAAIVSNFLNRYHGNLDQWDRLHRDQATALSNGDLSEYDNRETASAVDAWFDVALNSPSMFTLN